MIVDKKLNLVIPILRGDDTKLYIHATPIRPETFEQYYMVLAKTFSILMSNGLDPRSGPSVAAMVLRDVAINTARAPGINWNDGPDGVSGESGLLAEITRLSNAIVPAQGAGWSTTPLQVAIDQKLIDEEEKGEVLNVLAFFIAVSLVAPKADRARLVRGMAAIYDLQTTYFNATEFANSLKTSTTDASTGERPPA